MNTLTLHSLPTSKADLDDQRWLDERMAGLRDGMEDARDIWLNWTENRGVCRLAGGLSYGDFIASRLGYALPLAEVIQIMPGASSREIAKVAGVSHMTVQRSGVTDVPPDDQPATVLGADGKKYPARVIREVAAVVIETTGPESLEEPSAPVAFRAPFWPQLLAVRDAIRDLAAIDPGVLAANVPARRRRQFAKDLRHYGLVLGSVAARLEDME